MKVICMLMVYSNINLKQKIVRLSLIIYAWEILHTIFQNTEHSYLFNEKENIV